MDAFRCNTTPSPITFLACFAENSFHKKKTRRVFKKTKNSKRTKIRTIRQRSIFHYAGDAVRWMASIVQRRVSDYHMVNIVLHSCHSGAVRDGSPCPLIHKFDPWHQAAWHLRKRIFNHQIYYDHNTVFFLSSDRRSGWWNSCAMKNTQRRQT